MRLRYIARNGNRRTRRAVGLERTTATSWRANLPFDLRQHGERIGGAARFGDDVQGLVVQGVGLSSVGRVFALIVAVFRRGAL